MMKKLLATVLLLVVLLLSGLALWSIYVADKILPGVKVAGVNVGGLTPKKAVFVIENEIPNTKVFKFINGSRTWIIAAEDWDFRINYAKTVEKAGKAGRDSGWIQNALNKLKITQNGYWVEPVFELDTQKQTSSIEAVLNQIEVPAMNPQINYDKNGEINIDPGKNGVLVDRELLFARIKNKLFDVDDSTIEIPSEEVKPAISESQVALAKVRAQRMIGKKIEIINPSNKQKWVLTDREIIFWIDPANTDYKKELIIQWVNDLSPSVNKPAQNASFTIIGKNKLEEFKPEVWGLALNTPGTFEQIINALESLENGNKLATAELVLVKISPEITLDEISNLGLESLLGKGESWFSGSITNRIFNLKKAATELNGVIVPPGETFSFNRQVGEISSDTGYKQAYIIKEGKTILGDGGGVCQVSSTLFRAVLAAGLPIVERTAHAYRVHYYEEKYQPGFDATVFQPSPDFKFKNDTPAHLLIQMQYDEKAKYLSFEIYGTNDGRIAEVSKSRVWEQTPPPPDLYIDDPNLAAGKVVQTEHSAWGAKVAFDYKVTRGEEILQDRTFYSNYKPWQAVYLRGTKI